MLVGGLSLSVSVGAHAYVYIWELIPILQRIIIHLKDVNHFIINKMKSTCYFVMYMVV